MEHIIAGRFQSRAKADAAAEAIVRYVDRTDICIFHDNPFGQRGGFATGGYEAVNPGSAEAGLAAGLIVAIRIGHQTRKEMVVCDLRNCGAEDIEQAEGEWLDGDWVSCCPVNA